MEELGTPKTDKSENKIKMNGEINGICEEDVPMDEDKIDIEEVKKKMFDKSINDCEEKNENNVEFIKKDKRNKRKNSTTTKITDTLNQFKDAIYNDIDNVDTDILKDPLELEINNYKIDDNNKHNGEIISETIEINDISDSDDNMDNNGEIIKHDLVLKHKGKDKINEKLLHITATITKSDKKVLSNGNNNKIAIKNDINKSNIDTNNDTVSGDVKENITDTYYQSPPVSIHSDSDSEEESIRKELSITALNYNSNNSDKSKNSLLFTKSDNKPTNLSLKITPSISTTKLSTTDINKNAEIHEILSDKEDCVVIEDNNTKSSYESLLSPRRSQRQRKSIVKARDFSVFNDDDIQEIIEDPLNTNDNAVNKKTHMNQLTIKDPRSLAVVDTSLLTKNNYQQQSHNIGHNIVKKEPTLLIIDTNTLLSGRNNNNLTVQSLSKSNQLPNPFSMHPGVPAQGLYQSNVRTSITPVMQAKQTMHLTQQQQQLLQAHHQQQQQLQQQQHQQQQLLPALTDDMFVLEAPSFIVPYIYEKPPQDNLKEIVSKIGTDLKETIKKEQADKSINVVSTIKTPETKEDFEKENKTAAKKKRNKPKNPDDSWDETDTSTDDEASDSEQRTKILIKEVKEDLDTIKEHIITPESVKDAVLGTSVNNDPNKKTDNYFESPLGKFFMTIGINLVQEYVQTDLLRQQKKKKDREEKCNHDTSNVQMAINSLMKNLEYSKEQNEPFKFEMKRCEYCNFKSESALAMANHYETPHMRNYIYKCNFCSFECRPPQDILFHMEAVHNIKGHLDKAVAYHQCPNCPFEDNGKSKLARHSIGCAKKFRPDLNLTPPVDWESPAKIPRIKPRHGLVGTATAYQAMTAQQQRTNAAVAAAQATLNNSIMPRNSNTSATNAAALAAAMRGRGRPLSVTKPSSSGTILRTGGQTSLRPQIPPGLVLSNNYQLAAAAAAVAAAGSPFLQVAGTSMGVLPNSHGSLTIQSSTSGAKSKIIQQPSISITPLPRQNTASHNINIQGTTITPKTGNSSGGVTGNATNNLKPGQNPVGGKTAFVICEICDGYIKDLDQLRNHMQWIHKVKIHPKMIYNRPPLNCQKCQFRFFTDQGLERHLLGSHGLVTSSMQEAANKSKDSGRCPVCGRVYQWKLLNHVSRDHNMTLKPAHLSYKCTVCTATFGMYKQFESHVYSAHSTVAKKAMDGKKNSSHQSSNNSNNNNLTTGGVSSSSSSTTTIQQTSSSSSTSRLVNSGDSLLKPLKINDEITIIPQPASKIKNINTNNDIESHVID